MKRWNTVLQKETENTKVDEFLADFLAVCRKHGMTVADYNGGLAVFKLREEDATALLAMDDAADLGDYMRLECACGMIQTAKIAGGQRELLEWHCPVCRRAYRRRRDALNQETPLNG